MTNRGGTHPSIEYYPISWANATGTPEQLKYSAGTPKPNAATGYSVMFSLVATPDDGAASGPVASWTETLPVGATTCGGTKPMALQPGSYTLTASRAGSADPPVARPFHVR